MTKVRRSFDPDFRAGAVRIVKIVTTPVRAPRANAIAELFVGSLRCELLGRILIVNQRHAAAVLAEYERHFNEHRPHRSRPGSSPAAASRPRPIRDIQVYRRDRLGGLLHEYTQVA